MQLSEKAKKKMKFLSVKAVYEENKEYLNMSLETFYKSLYGREFRSETIWRIEVSIDETIKKLYQEVVL
jgi:predicted transcriptional regulator